MQGNKKKKTPPLANWLVSRLISDRLHEEFFGDLEEIYRERMSIKGKFYAILLYWLDVLHLLIGFATLKLFKNQNNHATMYKHYLLTSSRNLFRNKTYSIINILGLAIGMGVCLTICQYIYFELSYDKFHDNYRNTYRLLFDKTQNGVDQGLDPYVGYSVGVSAKDEIPEIKEYVRLYTSGYGAVVTNPDNNEPFNEDGHDMLFVDDTFLQVFDFPLKSGSKESVFDDMFNVVITEKAAFKYFGAGNPVGKVLKIGGGPTPGDYKVTGVLQELPVNSHLQFDFLFPIENLLELGWMGSVRKRDGWWLSWFATYVMLEESANPNSVSEKLDRLIVKHKRKWNGPENITEKARLQPVVDIHLKSESYIHADFVKNNGKMKDVQFFLIIASFILLIAWVNYINLSTARSMHRAKEVGIRKSTGAFRKQLISQFMMESLLVNFVSALLAIGITLLALPVLSGVLRKELEFSLLQIPIFSVWFLAVIILGSLLSGLYPAFVLSAFKPVSMLGTNKTAQAGNFNLRKGLIVFQFLISLLLISGTYLIYKQITFMKNQELGLDIEKIMVLKGPKVNVGEPSDRRSYIQAFREEVARHHSIASVSGSRVIPGQLYSSFENIRKLSEPAGTGKSSRRFDVGLDFLRTYGLELIAGSSFTKDMPDEQLVVINEEAVRAYGLASPENAIQQELTEAEDGARYKVIGVVKNFHWQSLREPHMPYLLRFDAVMRDYFSLRLNISDIQESLAHVESTYNSFFPDNAFDYFFLNDAYNRQYQADVQFGNLFFAFTALAIFIACVGLFALVSYSATFRIREIGIRKVFGAGTSNLMILLSREYLMLISIAIVLAIPATLFGGGAWLENYAFRVGVGFDVFIVPALVLIIISILTVSYRTYSTAKVNPVESLKTE